jgi:glycerate kinase
MSQRVLIAPDKFKGTLSASAAANAIARGWRSVRPDDTLELVPMSDGGDGFGEVLSKLHASRERSVKTFDAARRPCEPIWWFEPETSTAIIESAKCIGLAMLPPGKFHPFQLDTFGLGTLIHGAVKSGAKRCIIGVGGSATNDAGMGLARALGWRFLSKDGGEIGSWTLLHRVATVVPPAKKNPFTQMIQGLLPRLRPTERSPA